MKKNILVASMIVAGMAFGWAPPTKLTPKQQAAEAAAKAKHKASAGRVVGPMGEEKVKLAADIDSAKSLVCRDAEDRLVVVNLNDVTVESKSLDPEMTSVKKFLKAPTAKVSIRIKDQDNIDFEANDFALSMGKKTEAYRLVNPATEGLKQRLVIHADAEHKTATLRLQLDLTKNDRLNMNCHFYQGTVDADKLNLEEVKKAEVEVKEEPKAEVKEEKKAEAAPMPEEKKEVKAEDMPITVEIKPEPRQLSQEEIDALKAIYGQFRSSFSMLSESAVSYWNSLDFNIVPVISLEKSTGEKSE